MKKLAATAVLSAALLTGCAVAPTSTPTATATATTTVTATVAPSTTATVKAKAAIPTPTPTPAIAKTSGNYGADLAAAGIVPDDVADYGKFMKEQLCDAPLTGLSSFSESVRILGSSASDDVAKIRLSVAYFCPERVALGEKELRLHGYVK